MVAGIVRKLGVYMGDKIDPANSEDLEFLTHEGRRDIFEEERFSGDRAAYIARVSEVIAKRNEEFGVGGWKDPIAPYYMQDLFGVIRNPIFIFVTRDPGAIAQREKIEEGISTRRRLLGYINALRAYSQCVDIVNQRARPTLLISYERALRAPREAGQAIRELIGVDAPPDFDAWLETYILPDRLDGSIDLDAKSASKAMQFGSTDAILILLEESLRLQREGFLNDRSLSQSDPIAAGNRLFELSSAALSKGDYEEGYNSALGITGIFASAFPQLVDGVFGIIAHEIATGGEPIVYPDVVCGAFYLMGLSHLLRASAQKAMIYFKAAEAIMEARLRYSEDDSILCVANYSSCVFHLGVSAKVMQRNDIVDMVRLAFGGGRARLYSRVQHLPALPMWMSRVTTEL